MNQRDIALAIVALSAVIAIAILSNNGADNGGVAALIGIAGVALGRISGANAAPTEPTKYAEGHYADDLDGCN